METSTLFINEASTIITTLVVAGGFGLNILVQWRAGKKADENAQKQGIVMAETAIKQEVILNDTKTAVDQSRNAIDQSRTAIDQSRVVLNDVAAKTDGRLTEVIEKSASLEAIVADLRDQLKQAQEYQAKQQAVAAQNELNHAADIRAEERARHRAQESPEDK